MDKELKILAIEDIHPYAKNARRNDNAVDDVVESFKQCGYVAPIIVDENNEILAGHTRYKACQKLELKEIECMQVTGMTEAQKKKYRLLDNKTAEKSSWDFDLLEWELEDIDFEGYDFGFDIPNMDLDVNSLFTDAPEKEEKTKTIKCPECGAEFKP